MLVAAVNSRNACSWQFLFSTRSCRLSPAWTIHLVGSIRRFHDAFPPDFEVAAYRVSCLGNSYGTASLAMPSDAARELVRGQGGSRTLSGRVPASLFGQVDLSQHFSDSTNNRGRIGVCSESHLLRATDVECSTPRSVRREKELTRVEAAIRGPRQRRTALGY